MPSWYRINAEGSGPAVVYLYGVIGLNWWGEGNSALDFAKELDALGSRDIELRVNSEGGDVFEGYAIHTAIKRYPGTVTAYVDGLAASAASFIIRAADEIVMGELSMQMIHKAWSFALGNADELRAAAEILDGIDEQMLAVYAKDSTKSEEEIREALAADTWLSAEECVEWGLADRIEESLKAAACVSKAFAKQFKTLPEGVSVSDAPPTVCEAPETEPDPDTVEQELVVEGEEQELPAAVVRAYDFGVVRFNDKKGQAS